ncbi:MAG: 16S rRNA (adenine(1518)-N(6)/adenine(1519)-N(6))-dimethyltransferase RsmA [Treponema sp.]|jgi:16S rRNA (adenine1518-N6/adenine1519-N6)-dimethyltransferase|nr:16S rRNA (adenine(1518)-N(6)/adenine(1519)-N(6))-dimethyltransferase RsmA [Treponema sp.]
MEPNYNSAADLRAFLDEKGLGMRKKFGQNFLINPAIREALVRALEAPPGESVWEVGPGLGAMTSLLLEQGLSVRAFEIDAGFSRFLKEQFAANVHFTLVEGDVLKTWQAESVSPYLLGNLPYNIAAVLLADLIEKRRFFRRIVVTVQREVARRMTALPGSADYSSFSVLCSSVYYVKPLMVIKGAAFYPRPHVDSQALLLELNEDAASRIRPACFYPLIRRLFSSRRKTIKNNLTGFLPADAAAQALEKSSLDGGRRAENLTLDDFQALAKAIEDMGI